MSKKKKKISSRTEGNAIENPTAQTQHSDPGAGSKVDGAQIPFSSKNYKILLVCISLILLGFWLLSMDDFVDATQFSVSLYIAPIVLSTGFIGILYAIMARSKQLDA